ncbi:Formyltetrahydrofolate deformylase [Ophiocordyceps camponoti-floridani]|uniref:Formyltetrahydrofolate deformylase n=1 Tax=Ophiocordyceps camponoti-floridani TaxID=2030778 RepID=A0A8H4QF28_9HYPO|nr:Formyltetrahydrofolate deformylase [Ophiocordyceps camponoti-floridani]
MKTPNKMDKNHILTLSCPDRPGIIHAVTALLARHQLNIVDMRQFSDPTSHRFFMRLLIGPATDTAHLAEPLRKLADEFGMDPVRLRPATHRIRTLVMVSHIGHCLNDLVFRAASSDTQLPIEIVAVCSNHTEHEALARSNGVPFHHLPITIDEEENATDPASAREKAKAQQEERVLSLVKTLDAELVVLARYMQVLSPKLCAALSGRIINIHHSFLPSFKGARPYHQAYERGVKIIGATAHFVTASLDEGPIIEQRVARVDHASTPRELADRGSDIECHVLAAAVRWYAEGRVFLNGTKTVVFD